MFENPYIPISEAIVYIALRQWISVRQYIDGFASKDPFWHNPFQNIGPYYNINKAKVMLYLKGDSWTEHEWKETQLDHKIGVLSALGILEKIVAEVCEKFKITPHQAKLFLQRSVDLENEAAEKLCDAERQLINAARAGTITIYGARKGSDGNVEAVPLEFLRRSDFMTDLDGDRFTLLVDNSTTLEQFRKRQRVDEIGWHNLQIDKSKVSEWWPTPVYLSFKKIADRRLISSEMNPEDTMQELVQAFFRGEFEHNGQSLVCRMDLTPMTPPPPNNDRNMVDWPGHYWTGIDGLPKKTGDDGQHYLTADRQRTEVNRHSFLKVLSGTEFVPWAWDETDNGMLAFAKIALEKWPEKTRRVYFDELCLEEDDFTRWRRGTRFERDDFISLYGNGITISDPDYDERKIGDNKEIQPRKLSSVGRPSPKIQIYETLIFLGSDAEFWELPRGEQAKRVAAQCGQKLGRKGWGDRTVQAHIQSYETSKAKNAVKE